MTAMIRPPEDVVAATFEPEFSELVLRLLKGVCYRAADEQMWQGLRRLEQRIARYVGVLGLALHIDDSEGFARLAPVAATGDSSAVSDLLPHAWVSWPLGLLLALMRKALAAFDSAGEDERLVLDRAELIALLRPFLSDAGDRDFDELMRQASAHGFLRRLPRPGAPPSYEVRRILGALVDVRWLSAFDERLHARLGHGAESRDATSEPAS